MVGHTQPTQRPRESQSQDLSCRRDSERHLPYYKGHNSLNRTYCSCVSVTLPPSLKTRIIAQRERERAVPRECNRVANCVGSCIPDWAASEGIANLDQSRSDFYGDAFPLLLRSRMPTSVENCASKYRLCSRAASVLELWPCDRRHVKGSNLIR